MVKTRPLAQAIAAEGRLRIDGRVIERPAATVRVGNVLSFPLRNGVRVLRVIALPTRRGSPEEARGCYEDLTPLPANVSQEAHDD